MTFGGAVTVDNLNPVPGFLHGMPAGDNICVTGGEIRFATNAAFASVPTVLTPYGDRALCGDHVPVVFALPAVDLLAWHRWRNVKDLTVTTRHDDRTRVLSHPTRP